MKEIAEIRYTENPERLARLYYARYKVNYEKFAQEYHDSTPDSMKEFRDIFFDDRIVSENLIKNEKNTYFYNELSAVEKTEEGYLLYVTKNNLIFYGFDEFKNETLEALDKVLKPYYGIEKNKIIAVIENFEYTVEKIRKIRFKRVLNYRLLLVIAAFFLLMYALFLDRDNTVKVLYSIMAAVIFIQYLYSYFIAPKKVFESMSKRPLRARVVFFDNRLELINKSDAGLDTIKYNEFFKIKEIRWGFLFYIQKYKCFLFEYSEIEGDIENLKKILANNKRISK